MPEQPAPASDAVPGSTWDGAPVGLLRTDLDGRLLAVNGTLLGWLGTTADRLVGKRRLPELLTVGGRLFWETHLSPLVLVEGRLDEVALELGTDAGRMPVLLSAVRTGNGLEVAVSSARERVRFEQELQAARSAARTSARQLQALQDVTAALSAAVGVAAVGDVLLAAVTGALGAGGGALELAGPDGGLVPAGTAGLPAPDGGSGDDRTGDHTAGGAPAGGTLAGDAAGTVRLPLRGQRGLLGVLSLHPRTGPGADPLDREVCTAVAQQAGLALDRAQTYERSAGVASQLQAALLASVPPTDDRYAVATCYRPGVEALEVGGDFSDVFLSSPGVLSFVVGDVVGRGLTAASAMGQLRSAVRAIAAVDVGPGRLLSRLDHFVEQVEDAGMATLAYAELHLATGRVRYACAGHPPPLLTHRDGTPSLLWGGRSTPLGAMVRPRQRPEAELVLSPGDRLLLCTDGLFERRGRDLDDGLRRLLDDVGRLGGLPLTDTAGAVTASMLADEQTRDDVCLLLLEWCGDRFEHRLSADLRGLSAARRALGGWLDDRGVDEPARSELVLAASEAMANAGEHGSGGRPEESIALQAWLEPASGGTDDVVLSVSDHGRWRPPRASRSQERGRGLRIIDALVDVVDVRSDDGTTVLLRRRRDLAS